MRAWTWVLVAVMALTVVGCAAKREEELPTIDMATIDTQPPVPAETTAVVEPPVPAVTAVPKEPPAPAPGGSQTYTIQKGDTLYGLARRFYGDGKLWTRIADANKDKIRNVSTIPVGTVLVIPPK